MLAMASVTRRATVVQHRMPAEPPHPCGGRLRIHFQPPVCHNSLWLLDVFRFVQGGDGRANPLGIRITMPDADTRTATRSDIAVVFLCAAGLAVYFFFRAPRVPGIPWALWLGLAVFIAIVSAVTGLLTFSVATYLASGTSRFRSLLWYTLTVAVGIESAVHMAAVLGPIGGAFFGLALSAVLIALEVAHARSRRR